MVIQASHDNYLALLLNTAILTVLYMLIYQIKKITPLSKRKQDDISLRRILAGERISEYHMETSEFKHMLINFIRQMPVFAKYMLEALNIIMVLLLIIVYTSDIGSLISLQNQWFFRGTIVLFTINVIFLKKIGYTSFLQKLIVFTVINFAIYVSLLRMFGSAFGSIAFWGIVWNILSSLAIFYTPKTALARIFQKRDYHYRVATTLLALLVNIILLSKAELAGQLVFSLIFLYLGLEGMVLFYALKYINKMQS
ncbi:MAG: hypothetical protein GXP45_06335 [bacterium]|nr:hypothetical protein [bacterium]